MPLQIAIPVNRRTITHAAKMIPVSLIGGAVMYFAFGFLGALALGLVLFLLGSLLLKAAFGH